MNVLQKGNKYIRQHICKRLVYFIDFPYNFQMPTLTHHFLFVLIHLLVAQSQVLAPTSTCLGNCATCDPLSLTNPLSPVSCDWNFYPSLTNSSCQLAPSTEIVSLQLGQRIDNNTPLTLASGWSPSGTQSTCEYISSSGKKYIDVLGLYSGVQMLGKTFTVDRHSELFELSFTLLQDEWLPFNDFLIIDISSQGQNIQTLEISYDTRVKVNSQVTAITCAGTRVMAKKFSIKIPNKQRIDQQITLLFTSFLYRSVWGITNIRLQQGCLAYTSLNPNTQTCSQCDPDAYPITSQNADWCQKCPPLCKTCSESKCISCISGASVNSNGVCQFGSDFKTQLVPLGAETVTCDETIVMGSANNSITLETIKNDRGFLYNQIQLVIMMYYYPHDWNSNTEDYVSVKLNNCQIMKIDYHNLTNQGTDRCGGFKTNRSAKIQLFSNKIFHNDTLATLQFQIIGKNQDLQFGVGNIRVVSAKKIPSAQNATQFKQTNPNITTTPKYLLINETIDQHNDINPNNTSLEMDKINNNTQQLPDTTKKITNSNINTINQTAQIDQNIISNTQMLNNILNTNSQHILTPQSSVVPQSAMPKNTYNSTQILRAQIIPDHITILPQSPSQQSANQTQLPLSLPDKQFNKPQIINVPIINSTKITNQIDLQVSPITPPPVDSSSLTSEADPSSKQQAGQYLRSSAPNTTNSQQISFVPISTHSAAGLHILISGQPQASTFLYNAQIDKLSPEDYKVDSYYLQDGNLNLFLSISTSFTAGTVTIYRYAPTTARLLTAPTPVASLTLTRFDALSPSQLAYIATLSAFFEVAAWTGVTLIIAAVLLGCGVVVEQYLIGLQLLFLHVYIGTQYLPLSFREALGGLRTVENLNFLIPAWAQHLEHQLMGSLLQNGPVRFKLFHSDINFLRQFYPIIIVNIAYTLWFLLALLARKYLNKRINQEDRNLPHRLLDLLAGRIVNFCDQVWRYQFLATLWLCLMQFYNLAYPASADRSSALNAALCILSLLCSLAWPLLLTLYCRQQYYECEYAEYRLRFEDIYYLKIPAYQLPSIHQRIVYPLLRTVKLLTAAITICYSGDAFPLPLIALILANALEIAYIRKQQIYSDRVYFWLKVVENGVMAGLEVIMLVMLACGGFASTSGFVGVGFLMTAIAITVVLNAAARMAYLARTKWLELTASQCDIVFKESPIADQLVQKLQDGPNKQPKNRPDQKQTDNQRVV